MTSDALGRSTLAMHAVADAMAAHMGWTEMVAKHPERMHAVGRDVAAALLTGDAPGRPDLLDRLRKAAACRRCSCLDRNRSGYVARTALIAAHRVDPVSAVCKDSLHGEPDVMHHNQLSTDLAKVTAERDAAVDDAEHWGCEAEHFLKLACDDPGKNPLLFWKDVIDRLTQMLGCRPDEIVDRVKAIFLSGQQDMREKAAQLAKTLHKQPLWDHGHQIAEWYGDAVADAIRAIPEDERKDK